MSEATPEGGSTPGQEPGATEFKPITSQDDLNRIISERVKRTEAKYADHKDLKAKAARLDEIEQANQTEAQKAEKRIADLEAELSKLSRNSTRLKIASEHGITDADDIDLFLTGTDEETLTRQAKRLSERNADRKKNANRVPREGSNPTNGPVKSDLREFTRGIFGEA